MLKWGKLWVNMLKYGEITRYKLVFSASKVISTRPTRSYKIMLEYCYWVGIGLFVC